MSKETRNIIIAVVVSLILGFVAGSASVTGRCPITGIVICKDKAAACDRAKECAKKCDEACEKSGDKEAAPAAEKTEAAK